MYGVTGLVSEGRCQGIKAAARAVDIAVGKDAGGADLGRPGPGGGEGVGGKALNLSAKATSAHPQAYARAVRFAVGFEVNAGSKGRGSVGAAAQPALDLDGAERRGQIGHVDPEQTMGFGVVNRNTVERHIDAGHIGTADSQIGIANAGPCIGGGEGGGLKLQNIRHVLTGVLFAQFVAIHPGGGDRGSWQNMSGRDDHLFPHQDRGLHLQDPISKGIQAEIAAGSQGNLHAQGLVANITNQEFLGSQRSFQDKFTLVVGGSTPRGSLPKQGGAGQGLTLGINNAAMQEG